MKSLTGKTEYLPPCPHCQKGEYELCGHRDITMTYPNKKEAFIKKWVHGYIGDFISELDSLLLQERERVVKEIEKRLLKMDLDPMPADHETLKELNSFSGYGYGQAWMMKQFLSLLSTIKE